MSETTQEVKATPDVATLLNPPLTFFCHSEAAKSRYNAWGSEAKDDCFKFGLRNNIKKPDHGGITFKPGNFDDLSTAELPFCAISVMGGEGARGWGVKDYVPTNWLYGDIDKMLPAPLGKDLEEWQGDELVNECWREWQEVVDKHFCGIMPRTIIRPSRSGKGGAIFVCAERVFETVAEWRAAKKWFNNLFVKGDEAPNLMRYVMWRETFFRDIQGGLLPVPAKEDLDYSEHVEGTAYNRDASRAISTNDPRLYMTEDAELRAFAATRWINAYCDENNSKIRCGQDAKSTWDCALQLCRGE